MNSANKIALGTVQFGLSYGIANQTGQVPLSMARSILATAANAGVDTIDTAMAYGNSEGVLGEIGVRNWNVVTKLPATPEDNKNIANWVKDQVQGSLDRLGILSLDALMLHRPMELLSKNGEKLYASLQQLKSDGTVKKIGISVYGVSELEALISNFPCDIVQAPLNILDQRLVTSGWATLLKKTGVEIHTRSAFLQGLLLMTEEQRPAKFRIWPEVWNEWHRWLIDTGLTPLQACMQYVGGIEAVDRVVVGVDCVDHLTQILSSLHGTLPSLPNFQSFIDDRLINPAIWSQL